MIAINTSSELDANLEKLMNVSPYSPTSSINLTIGDITLLVKGSKAFIETISPTLTGFIDDKKTAFYEFTVLEKDLNVSLDLYQGTWREYSGDWFYFIMSSSISMINYKKRKVRMLVNKTPVDPDHFGAALRATFPMIAIRRKCAIFHSVSVIDKNHSFLFIGPSGAGKSTLGLISKPRTILSDESVLVDINNDHPVCWGTPFSKDLIMTNTYKPLKACCLLVQDEEIFLEPLDLSSSLNMLLTNLWPEAFAKVMAPYVFDTCLTMAKTVPIYTLHFFRDPKSIWKLLDKI